MQQPFIKRGSRVFSQVSAWIAAAPSLPVYLYIAVIVLTEVFIAFNQISAGIITITVVLFVLFNHFILAEDFAYRRLLPALALIPLARLLGLILPIPLIPRVYWYIVTAVPLGLVLYKTGRLLNLDPVVLINLRRIDRWQVLIALAGMPYGLLAYLLVRPKLHGFNLAGSELFFGPVILLLFASLPEELIFRGYLQRMLLETLGRKGLYLSAALYAVTWMSSRSIGLVIVFGLFGAFATWFSYQTKSLFGIIISHGLLIAGMTYLWPLLFH